MKHGWILRRVLLNAGLRESLGNMLIELFEDAPIAESEIDAVWFSRPPEAKTSGEIAWELRHLSETPFALLVYVNEDSDDLEQRLSDVESRLVETIARRK